MDCKEIACVEKRCDENIINAMVHADYSQRGAPIRVVFLDDRIEVESPGILLSGLTIEDMKQGTSRIRNYVIGDGNRRFLCGE